jgi:hypothetical protein
MAKATGSQAATPQPLDTSSLPSVHSVAEGLFQQSWRPRGSIDAWMIAVECYRGAQDFLRVAGRIADGLGADDVIAEQQLIDEQQAETKEPIQNTGG